MFPDSKEKRQTKKKKVSARQSETLAHYVAVHSFILFALFKIFFIRLYLICTKIDHVPYLKIRTYHLFAAPDERQTF